MQFILLYSLPWFSSLLLAQPPNNLQEEASKRILFVGNSYTQTNDLPQLVQSLTSACGHPKPIIDAVVLGGVSLRDHWTMQVAPRKISGGRWDYVILQQGPSSMPANGQELVDSAKQAVPWIQQAGGKAAYFMVWPEKNRQTAFPAVREAYARAAQESGGILLPAGRAWQLVLERNGKLALYSADQLHPTPEGSYLAAMTIVAKLYDVPPGAMPGNLRWTRFGVNLKLDLLQLFQDCVEAALKEDTRP